MITLLHYIDPDLQHAVKVIPDISPMNSDEVPIEAVKLAMDEAAKNRIVGCIQDTVEGHTYFSYDPEDMASMEASILAALTVSHALVQYSITRSELVP
jgi:hypothetical protein